MVSQDSDVLFPDRTPVAGERSARVPVSPLRPTGRVRVTAGTRTLLRLDRPSGVPPTNLPPRPRSIVGREHDLAQARAWLLRADTRLLTLVGPPGVGKTRLAVELAASVLEPSASAFGAGVSFPRLPLGISQASAGRDYRSAERHRSGSAPTAGAAFDDGVWLVDLAPIGDPAQVADAMVRGLGLRDVGRQLPADALVDALRQKSLLLVLDNFEQVLDAADLVGRLLAACPSLKLLVTSRAPLHLSWERELPVRPLALPSSEGQASTEALAASPAVQLFVERAQAVVPSFVLGDAEAAAVAEICAHLDGLPLAIELAAARIKLFSPAALARRLAGADPEGAGQAPPLHLLAGASRDVPARQQTLWSAIAWSYDLLTAEEQAVFRRLAVFVGGCTLGAAERVASSEERGTRDAGAMNRAPTGSTSVGARFIAPSDSTIAPSDSTTSPSDSTTSPLVPHNSLLDVMASLMDKSLVWREEQSDGEPRLRLLETLREYAQAQLEASGEAETTRARHTAYYLDLAERAEPELHGPDQQRWLALLERERDNLQAVERWAVARDETATVLRLAAALWPFWLARGDASDARNHIAAIRRMVGRVPPTSALAHALHGAGLLAEKLGDFATCRALLEDATAAARQIDDRRALAGALDSLGRQAFVEGRYDASRTLLEESLALHRQLGERVGLARVLSHYGFLEYLEGHLEAAHAIFQEGLALAREVEDRHRVAEFLDNLGTISLIERDFDEAARMFQDAATMWREMGQRPWLAMALNNLGVAQTHRGELTTARARLLEGLDLARRIGNRRRETLVLSALATLAAAEGRPEEAVRLDAVATTVASEIGVMLAQPRYTLGLLHLDGARQALGEPGVEAARARGRATTLDQAVEECLSAPAPPALNVPRAYSSIVAPPAEPGSATSVSLTHRERETVVLVARGLTNRQIAEALVVTEGTAANYVQRVLSKLGFNVRAQIAAWAVEHDLGPAAEHA